MVSPLPESPRSRASQWHPSSRWRRVTSTTFRPPSSCGGFIRSYAREVHLDPSEALARYDSHLAQRNLQEPADNSGSLGPLILGKTDLQREGNRGLQISHVLLLVLALVTFIIAYVSAGTTSTPSMNNAAAGGDTAQTERASGLETTVSR